MPRRLTLLPLLLIFAFAPAAPAVAHHHRGWDTSGDGQVAPGDEPYTDPAPAPPAPPTAPATTTAPPTTTVPPTTLPPATPWQPEDILPTIPVVRTVPGKLAQLRRDGRAAIPRGAPKRVQALIAAANRIVGKPYKWGGGHAKLVDAGYDCSGAVSYALIGAGLLASPMVSGTLARWAARGDGRWLSIYANKGHVYLEVAGLRLDTSPVGDGTRLDGVRWRPVIGRRAGFSARHPLGL